MGTNQVVKRGDPFWVLVLAKDAFIVARVHAAWKCLDHCVEIGIAKVGHRVSWWKPVLSFHCSRWLYHTIYDKISQKKAYR